MRKRLGRGFLAGLAVSVTGLWLGISFSQSGDTPGHPYFSKEYRAGLPGEIDFSGSLLVQRDGRTYALVLDRADNALLTVDATDPAAPQLLSRFPQVLSSGIVTGISSAGDRIVLTWTETQNGAVTASGFHLLDPNQVGAAGTTSYQHLLLGTHTLSGDAIFAGAKPEVKDVTAFRDESLGRDYLVVASTNGGVRILDATSPASVYEVLRISVPDATGVDTAQVNGKRVLFAASGGLSAQTARFAGTVNFDLSNPTDSRLSTFRPDDAQGAVYDAAVWLGFWPATGGRQVLSQAVLGTQLVQVVKYPGSAKAGVSLFPLANVQTPKQIPAAPLSASPADASQNPSGWQDAVLTAEPSALSVSTLWTGARSLLFSRAGSNGLLAWDVTDAAGPALAGNLTDAGIAPALSTLSTLGALAEGTSGLSLLDLRSGVEFAGMDRLTPLGRILLDDAQGNNPSGANGFYLRVRKAVLPAGSAAPSLQVQTNLDRPSQGTVRLVEQGGEFWVSDRCVST